ncbi:18204_t:CDS:1, partial [Dentiscutata erythropus]
DSLQMRKESMHSVQSGNRPDLQVFLMLDSAKWELSFAEISCLAPRADKQEADWKKINCLCKDGIDVKFENLFKGRNVECDDAGCLINELLQIHLLGFK